ncbi:hypothetical protein BKA93DRAFT_697144, partial [Sparassis latifolia]
FFHQGANTTNGAPVICAICLGIHPQPSWCNAPSMWDGKPACCHCNFAGHIVNPGGEVICTDWQLPNSCSPTAHVHKCS